MIYSSVKVKHSTEWNWISISLKSVCEKRLFFCKNGNLRKRKAKSNYENIVHHCCKRKKYRRALTPLLKSDPSKSFSSHTTAKLCRDGVDGENHRRHIIDWVNPSSEFNHLLIGVDQAETFALLLGTVYPAYIASQSKLRSDSHLRYKIVNLNNVPSSRIAMSLCVKINNHIELNG